MSSVQDFMMHNTPKLKKVRRLVKNILDRLFKDHEALILPISPVMPWKIGTKMDDPVSVYLADIFTVMANVWVYQAFLYQVVEMKRFADRIQIVSRAFGMSRPCFVGRPAFHIKQMDHFTFI